MKELEEFFKKQIEELCKSTKEIARVNKLDVLDGNIINNFDGPVETVAYNLLKEIRDVGGDEEETIYNEFLDYLEGRKYNTLDEFLKWLEEV